MRGLLLLSLASAALPWSLRAAEPPAVSTAAAPSAVAPTPASREAEPNIAVEKIVFAVDVSSRVPVGAAESFGEAVSDVFCWNQISVTRPPANVLHQWFWNDKKVGEVSIHARFKRMRIWSRRKVRPGQWRVEIKDGDTGSLLAIGTFPVKKPAR